MTGLGNRTYLVGDAGGPAALIDAGVGVPAHLAAIDGALQARRSTLASLIVTHAHSDHVGGAAALAAAHPTVVCRKYPWPEEDARAGVRWTPLADDQVMTIGTTALVVIHTPGHSPDHCAFWHEASGSIFAGDLVIPGGSVVIQTARGGDMRAYLASLERLIALNPKRLFPAHGDPVENPGALLRVSIRHRLQRERQVARAVADGHSTIAAITESIYHGLPASLMPAARDNVTAHLEKLRHDRPGFDGPVE